MKISLKWLGEFVEISDYLSKPQALAEILTRAGLEVEEISSKAQDLQNVVVGLILQKDKHPNADKLSLCQVMTGEGVVHQIVCGAQNHKADDRVVVALPGAVLPGNFAIKKAVVRGVDSGGMLCSLKELGLATESNGIEILPIDAPIGKSYAAYKGLDDVTFELKVTPNRADCLSHYGLAREVACLLDRPIKKISSMFQVSDRSTQSQITLQVDDAESCPRYCGRWISGVKVAPSPEWLKKRIETVGLKSINNVVDVTNYVMMELGQPLHAFDAAQIHGQKIRVAKAQAGESFTTLDGTVKKLSGEELVIADQERTLALAGVVGGQNSGISDQTQDLFLEAAYFEPSVVRKTCRSLGLQTDSAYRFTRGVDPDGVMRALERATELILNLAGGSAFANPHDFYPNPIRKSEVTASLSSISDRLGYPVQADLFESFMQRLSCHLEKLSDGEYKVRPPTFRFDLESEIDLVEEYARLYGYDQIPEKLPLSSERPAAHESQYTFRQKTSRLMRASGYSEAVNSAFAAEAQEKSFLKNISHLAAAGLQVSSTPIRLRNPLSDDQNVMRSTLTMSLWKNALDNYRKGNESGRLFEIGKTFEFKANGEYAEHTRLALIAWGYETSLWAPRPEHFLVYEIKTAISELISHFGVSSFRFKQFEDRSLTPDFMHRGQFAVVEKEGTKLGFIGSLHPVLLAEEKVRCQVAVAEIELEPLFKGQPRAMKYQDFSRFPKIERDLSLLMPKNLPVTELIAEMKKSAGAELREVQVFDQFVSDQLPAGQRSVAFRLSFQDPNGTLQDEKVQSAIQSVLGSLERKWSISTR